MKIRKARANKIKSFGKKKAMIHMIGLRVTEKEFNDITRHCKQLGVSKSRFFRYLWNEHLEYVVKD